MKIKIKTSLITLDIEDEIKEGGNGYLRHDIPDFITAVKSAIDEAIRLHNEANKEYGN
mgnify:CR=1 FL=1